MATMKNFNANKLGGYLILLGLLFLNGCGFHLRGINDSYKLPFDSIYLQCDGVAVCNVFTSIINEQNLSHIASKAESADIIIKIYNEQTSREAQNFNAMGRVAKYLLTYKVTAQIIKDHEVLGNDIAISVSSIVNYNDSLILSANQNEANIWKDLHVKATDQLIRKIIYQKDDTSNDIK